MLKEKKEIINKKNHAKKTENETIFTNNNIFYNSNNSNNSMSTEITLIHKKDLSLVENGLMNESQIKYLLKRTPKEAVRKRPAKGGGEWEYVSGGWVKKQLNMMFGFNWDFEITNQMVLHGEAIVQGKLTCRSNGVTIIKTQFGNKDVVYKKQTDIEKADRLERIPLSIGNDLKAAATDCLKKCAAEIGIAADIYNKLDFEDIKVVNDNDVDSMIYKLNELYVAKADLMNDKLIEDAKRILNKEKPEIKSFTKLYETLSKL